MKWFLNLKVGQKLFLGFGVCLALAVFAGGIAFHSFSQLDSVSDIIEKEAIPGTTTIAGIGMETRALRIREIRFLTADAKEQQQTESDMAQAIRGIAKQIDAYGGRITQPVDKQNFAQFRLDWSRYLKLHQKLIDTVYRGDRAVRAMVTGLHLYNTEMKTLFKDNISVVLDRMLRWNQDRGIQLMRETRAAHRVARIQIFVLLLCMVLLGVGIAWFITRSLTRSLTRVATAAQTLALGDTSDYEDLPILSRDEIGTLTSAFNHMAYEIKEYQRRVHDRSCALEEAHDRLERQKTVLENAVEGIGQLDEAGFHVSVNTAYADMLGYKPEEMIGIHWETIIHSGDHVYIRRAFETMLLQGKAEVEVQSVRKDGSAFFKQVTLIAAFDPSGHRVGTHCFTKDISDRRALENQIVHQAFYDALTGLPNRTLFVERMERSLEIKETSKDDLIAVMFVDLDNFKVINDSLGHEEGDRLLVTVAERLQECVRPGDTVARQGGDEFTILLEGITCEQDVIQVAERIIARLHEPIRLAAQEVFITSSIGIAVSSRSDAEMEILVRDSDTAMYQAKLSGKAGYVLFDSSMNERVVERMEIENGLRRALEKGEFRVLYQPIIDLETGEITGAEALVRWEHPKLGTVQPVKFIPIAEETGLIIPIGAWVLREACLRAKAWQDEHGDARPFVMSVNLSGRQLQSPDLLETITGILQETCLSPDRLKLEITESVMMEDLETAISRLNELKALGIRLAVDDFGTGYSSLSYLQRLPVDTVKIDRSFINNMGEDLQPAAIVQTIIMLCRALNLDVTGEGIENSGQLVQLQTIGCHHGQGFHFAHPVTAEDFNAILKIGRMAPHRQEEIQEPAPQEDKKRAA